MLTASRAAWFATAFAFAVPATVIMFRSEGTLTRETWVKALLFAASIAAVAAIVLGKGKP
ncbi:hypothetical protein J7F03_10115 [Streptomyces sp. ISL-43]|uniref:hypothetical protein n=1 Tax=Streptomyces sp. ISL-43 TaxID=2819183 RepID=UPI001BECA16B|nr:hypothetical protein [Streptomyces sp. ISL-43]MBT2447423.1 hypothetical protein [Streptomyces sp. ISL-43]